MKSRLAVSGLTVLCCSIAGMGASTIPIKAETPPMLVAQQSELEEAESLFQAGIALYQEGNLESLQEAIRLWELAVPLYESAGAQKEQAVALLGIGRIHDALGEKEIALGYYNQALPLSRAVGDRSGEATTLNNIGSIHSTLGDKEKALSFFNQALPLWQALGDRTAEANTLNNIGAVHDSLGDKETALNFYDQALTLLQAAGDRSGEANTLSNIGAVHDSLGDKETALSYYNQALTLKRAVGDRSGEANTLNNIGAVHDSLGEKETALSFFNQALGLLKAVGDRNGEANTLNNIGAVHDALGEKETALSFFNQALPLLQAVGDRSGQAATLHNIGRVHDALGEKETALSYYDQALPLLQAVGDRSGEANTLNNIGAAHDALGDQETALNFFNQALPLLQAVGDRSGQANTLNNIGAVHNALDDKETALNFFNQALPLLQAVGDRSGQANTLNNIGVVQNALGDPETALSYYDQALPLNRAVGDRSGEAVTLGNLAQLSQAQGAFPQALENINDAIALVESLRSDISPGDLRASYFATVQDYYTLKQDILMQLGQPEAAFETSEAARARLLSELLSESNVDIRQGVSPNLLDQEKTLQQQLEQLEQQRITLLSGEHTLEQAENLDQKSNTVLQQRDQIIAQIRSSSPAYAEIVQPQPLALAQIQQQVLDADTVLMQYALGEDQSYLWLVGQNHFQAYTLPGETEIKKAAAQFQSVVTSSGNLPSDAKRKGDDLLKLILPEQPDWLQGKRLLVAGDGILAELPFAALPLPNEAAYTPLLVEHEVLMQPSITAIAVLRQQLANRGELLPSLALLADPVYHSDDERFQSGAQSPSSNGSGVPIATDRNLRDLDLRAIQRLPYTRQESDNILKLAAQNNLETINVSDFDADANWVKAPELKNYTMVHLATHGFINPVNPQLSGIVLTLVNESGQLKENGFLRLHDIFNLDLVAELVVLSACQTGTGENVSGEGIIGLSRGFMYAGAERVAVSLWNVNDAATAELMSEFYQYILEEDLSPAAAMRAAQIDAWQAGNSPYLWAAFTLQGEWQR